MGLRGAARRAASAAMVAAGMVALCAAPGFAQESPEPAKYLQALDDSFFLQRVDEPISETVRNHLIALGAMQKVRGVWAPRGSERISGERTAFTWKADEGFTIGDALEVLDSELAGDESVETLFACEAVSCGSSVQWANRIFRERLLYGTQASQVYRAYALKRGEVTYRLLVYGAARTVERQYLRAELFALTAPPQSSG